MATLARPKHGDRSSYRSRNAQRRHDKKIDPPPERHRPVKPRDLCKQSPDTQHVFAEYMCDFSFVSVDGIKRMTFVLSCVYCHKRAWHEGLSYEMIVKRVQRRVGPDRTRELYPYLYH